MENSTRKLNFSTIFNQTFDTRMCPPIEYLPYVAGISDRRKYKSYERSGLNYWNISVHPPRLLLILTSYFYFPNLYCFCLQFHYVLQTRNVSN